MNLNRHVWEGWTPQMFINEMEMMFDMIMNNQSWKQPFKDKEDLKQWCKDNQPGYKKHVPEVFNYFKKKAKL